MKKMIDKSIVRDLLLITVGTTLLAMAINMFFDKLDLVTGGVTGLAIVIKAITQNLIQGGIPLWITNIALNIPLFIIGTLLRGKHFGGKTLFATLYLSFALYYTSWLPAATSDFLLASLFGGVLGGVGLGLVFAAMATTGGTDLAASILQMYFKHISVAQIMFMLDAMIITAGFFVFGAEKTMYAIISVYIMAKMVDGILEGIHFSKAAFIISEKADEIAEKLMSVLDRGVTGLKGQGMFTRQDKQVLLCVVSKKQIVRLKEIVAETDKTAFVTVADVREVLGEGFIQYHED